ncbi:ABC transporter ATP-binding protein [Leptolyngbya sp. FACHB-261]|uniref:ABC transporter ATP-binding protein n=1 Tax=Leptolyngbya sp. FACHB-261 TaxID=2692806 RepID=UPI001688C6E8|nr:ABC transporter ATP-binding protein [Leptolyngbya sp. FACHB-261]MBD2103233.1 ABC transporter ATP-binding protein [Leptolyngbya sp. FACHB-261]
MIKALSNPRFFKKLGPFERLASSVWQVPRKSLYFGLVMMFVASVLDAISIGLMIPFLKILLNEGNTSYFPQTRFTEGLNSWLVQQPKSEIVGLFALILVGVFILKSAFYYIAQVITAFYRESVIELLKKRIYQIYLYSPMSFFDEAQIGKIMSTLHGELLDTKKLIGAFFLGLSSLMILLAYLGVLLLVSWRMTLLTALLISSVALGLTVLLRQIKRDGNAVVVAKRALNALALDSLGGIRIVKSYGTEEFELERFNHICDDYMEANLGLARKQSLIDPLTELVTLMAAMLILVGSYTLLISKGLLGTSELLIFMLVLIKIVPITKRINSARGLVQESQSSLAKVAEALSIPLQYPVPSGSEPFRGLRQSIAFNNVRFSYNGRTNVLNGISLEIPQGKTIALVGGSGAGKSTIAALIPRFYEVTEGSITLDGKDIRQYDPISLRQCIGIVSQDTYIFNASILENIAYGLKGVDRAKVVEAARLANAHGFICQLSEGYDTVVGDRGVKLSGGQRQRISIARAMLRDPEILILDEATSALDSQSEHLVQEAIERLRCNRTVIVIAHRLSTVRNADRIVVLEKGQIVEQGEHDQLLATRGLYWSYHNLQSLPV